MRQRHALVPRGITYTARLEVERYLKDDSSVGIFDFWVFLVVVGVAGVHTLCVGVISHRRSERASEKLK
jgi:multisubunit Na+/H+ antiporter MnhB subunit